MKISTHRICPYPTADEGAKSAKIHIDSPQTRSLSYKLAFQDEAFLLRDECLPVRLQLELLKPELSFQFHYFAIRKMHFLMRAKGLVAFPGGFGTMDELFETPTLVQTHKINPIPIVLFGKDFWERLIRFDVLVEEGTISPEDLSLFQYVETAEEAWEIIRQANH